MWEKAANYKLQTIQRCPNVSVVDLPDQAFHLNADPDLDPAFHLKSDPDPDPGSQINADPYEPGSGPLKVEFYFMYHR
jgi:hypothetical protein